MSKYNLVLPFVPVSEVDSEKVVSSQITLKEIVSVQV